MLFFPFEGGAFASQIDKRAGNCGVVLDPDAHVAGDAKESADVGEILAFGPVANLHDFGVVRDAALIIASVPKDGNFWCSDGKLLGRYGCAGTKKAVKDAVDITDVLPDEVMDLQVSRNRLIPSVLKFVTCLWSLDTGIVHKGHCRVGDLGLKNESDITMEYCNGSGPSLWHHSLSDSTYRGLDSCKIAGSNVKQALIIARI